MYMTPYEPPVLTVDAVIFRVRDGSLEVLLIKRAHEPFQGEWALPGGYCPAGETTRDAFKRVLLSKAGLDEANCKHIEQLYTADTVARDPRGHAVSVIYMGLGTSFEVDEGSAQRPTFFPVDALPDTAYDHTEIIQNAIERLRSKLTYSNTAFSLLPKQFTLTQLQAVYEAILGYELDKRNFRKKILSLDLLTATDETFREGAHRPAKLYTFRSNSFETLDRSFLYPKT